MSLTSAGFFALMYFSQRSNGSDTDFWISAGVTVVALIFSVLMYALQNKVISNELVAYSEDEEAPSIGEALAEIKSAIPATLGVLLVCIPLHFLIIPLLVSLVGGIFNIKIDGFVEFNLLALVLNLIVVMWLFLATAQINAMGASFVDTIKYSTGFVFTNLSKCVIAVLAILFCLFIYNFTILSTMSGNFLINTVIRVVITAYLLGFVNTYFTSLFINNVTEEDLMDDEELYGEE